MASARDQYSVLYRENQVSEPVAKQPQRYWRGKVPDRAVQSDEEEEASFQVGSRPQQEPAAGIRFEERRDNSRMNERLGRIGREVRKTAVVVSAGGDGMSEREKRKQKALQNRREQQERKRAAQEKLRAQTEGEQQQQDSEQAEEGEQDEDEAIRYKPVFVPKEERLTIIEKERAALEAEAREEAAKARRDELQQQTQVMVEAAVKREEELKDLKEQGYDSEGELPEDGEKAEEWEYEYEQWRLRELGRIQRDRQERLEREVEKKEIERRHALTQEEREREDAQLGTDANERQEGQKYSFMQKYYKSGGFFQGGAGAGGAAKEGVYARDYNAPTAMDTVDKSGLPSVLQKRRGEFGKKGQSKWTHLGDQDTTLFERDYMTPAHIHERQKSRMAGYKASSQLDRPSYKRRL